MITYVSSKYPNYFIAYDEQGHVCGFVSFEELINYHKASGEPYEVKELQLSSSEEK